MVGKKRKSWPQKKRKSGPQKKRNSPLKLKTTKQ